MDDQRSGWLTAASTAAALGSGALFTGIIVHSVPLWIVGLIILAASIFCFSSVLRDWPINFRAQTQPDPLSIMHEPTEELPAFMIPVYSSGEQEMQQLGPFSWLSGFGPREPDVTLRAVVALPAVSASDYSGELATNVRGEARENWLIDLLNSSEFTSWLRRVREPAQWLDEPKWQVRGSGFADLTELVFAPSAESNEVLPFLARCAVLTGWRSAPDGVKQRAIRFLVEIQFNRWANSPPQIESYEARPELAKINLDDIAADFLQLSNSLNLAKPVTAYLLPESGLTSGFFGLWFTVRGHMLEQVVDLSGVTRVAGAIGRNDAVTTGVWESLDGPDGTTWGVVIANMLDNLLEGAGYRGVGNRFDWLRSRNSSSPDHG